MQSKRLEDELSVGQARSFGSFVEAERAIDAARKRFKRGKTTAKFSMKVIEGVHFITRVE